MFALACTPNNLDGIPQNFLSCKFSKTLLIGYIIAIIDVLSSMFSDLTKFQKWAKGISIFLLINKVFKTSNWKQLLLWPMAKDFCETSMTKRKLFSLEMHFKQAIWEQTIFYVSGIPRWNFGFKIRRCDCAFTETSNIIWFQDTCTFEVVNFVALNSYKTRLCMKNVYFRKKHQMFVNSVSLCRRILGRDGCWQRQDGFNWISIQQHLHQHHHHHPVRFQICLWCLNVSPWCLNQNMAADRGKMDSTES